MGAVSDRIRDAKRIDFHNHVQGNAGGGFARTSGRLDRRSATAGLRKADKLHIDFLCISAPLTTPSPTPEQFRKANDVVLQAMELSERFLGFCFVNPGYAREAAAEIRRCVTGGGMVGVKLYHQYTLSDPAQTAVMETAAELHVPVLMHAGKVCDSGTRARQPNLSNAQHFVDAARMFPNTIFVQGHIGGGGDWEWNVRVLEERPNTYIDTSGSVIDRGIVERTVAALGVERTLFATDMSYEEGVGKVLDSRISEADKAKIFAENAKAIFAMAD